MRLFELFIGIRYLKSKKNQGFISFNTILSMVIVFIGVFILILVISVMNGFQAQIKDKILDVDAHITVTNLFGGIKGKGIKKYDELIDRINKVDGVKSATPFVQGQGLLRYKSYISYVMVRGTGDKNGMPEDIKKFIRVGKKEFTSNKDIFIGEEMGKLYNISLGQNIEIIVPKGKLIASQGVEPGLGKYKVAGFFKTGYYEFDTKLIIMSMPGAQKLYSVGDIAWGINVKINDVYGELNKMDSKIQDAAGYGFVTQTAEQKNENLFHALKLEKLIMTIILFLVIISAGFTIMGTLVMVVMEKKKAIGILKAMGARPRSIMMIFILEGFFIGFIGAVFGVIFGLAASLNLEAIIHWVEDSLNSIVASFHTIFNLGPVLDQIVLVPSNIYYIDSIPTEINPEFVVFISICAVFLSTIAAMFPAWSASRLKPVDTIRYE